jgi:3',5'-cyclic AMP phosphodiesterase CpdA
MVVTGDLVGTGTDEGAWEAFFASAPELLATVPMIAAHGNHEANAINFYSLMAMPGDEESFGFDFGALHQVVVNSDPEHRDDVSAGIADFLDADLAATGDARWTSVAMHRSLWSPSTAHGSDQTLRAAWGPILDAHQVDLVVSGHDHIFARTQPIRDEQVAEEGTIYLVTGGAGAPLYGLVDPLPDYVAVAESTFHATLVSVRRDLLSSESFRDDGSPLDSFVITRP